MAESVSSRACQEDLCRGIIVGAISDGLVHDVDDKPGHAADRSHPYVASSHAAPPKKKILTALC